jgi:hypothetical protein
LVSRNIGNPRRGWVQEESIKLKMKNCNGIEMRA